MTWFRFAQACFAAAGHDPARVVPITTRGAAARSARARPAFSVLDHSALRAVGLPPMPSWDGALAAAVAALTG